jgi:Chaperone of endosialidase
MADGLNMLPRIGEPETSGVSGQSFPAPELTAGGPSQFLAPNIPDTSGPGPTPLQQPGAWAYDFDPASGIARATFNGEVSGGGGGSGDVTSWNTRVGDVTLLLSDINAAGGAPIASPVFTGNPAAPTRLAGDSSGGLATTAFVQQAIVANQGVSSFNARTGTVTLSTADVLAAGGAPLASPALTGTPTAPTASQGDVSNQIATDAFVSNAIAAGAVTSFNGRRGAVALTLSDVQSVGGAPIASPTFTGTPAVPTAAPGSATTQAASTAFVTNAITAGTAGVSSVNTRTGAVVLNASDLTAMGGAPLLSPTFTGTPAAPTPTAGDSSTRIATTAYVETAIGALPVGVATWNGRTGTVTMALSDVTSVGGAPLASPIFTGTPEAPTPPALDNSLRLATTAFVDAALPIASTAAPLVNGTAAAGSSPAWSPGDHVHPTDTSRAAASALASYLPLAGGTLTGTLNGVAATFSGVMTVANNLISSTGAVISRASGAGNANLFLQDNTGTNRSAISHNPATSSLTMQNIIAASTASIGADGTFSISNAVAYKPGGGSWTAPSDERIKTIAGDYDKGLAEVMQLRPVSFVFKGNDTLTDDTGGSPTEPEPFSGEAPFPASPHYTLAMDQTPFVGLIAQELETVFPEMVTTRAAFIDGEPVADLRSVDVSNLVFALVNAVKTLAARVEALEAVR